MKRPSPSPGRSSAIAPLPGQADEAAPPSAAARAFAHATFIIVGMMGAWSFHCFLADPHFIQHLYQYTADDAKAKPAHPWLWTNVANLVTLTRLVSNTLAQSINATPCVRHTPKLPRIFGGVCLDILVVMTPLLLVLVGAAELTAFTLLLTAVFASGIATGFQQATTFSVAALFTGDGYRFSMSTLLGMGVAATATSVAKAITKSSFGKTFSDQKHESFVFFGLGAVWACVAMAVLAVFMRTALGRSRLSHELGVCASCAGVEGDLEDERDPLRAHRAPSTSDSYMPSTADGAESILRLQSEIRDSRAYTVGSRPRAADADDDDDDTAASLLEDGGRDPGNGGGAMATWMALVRFRWSRSDHALLRVLAAAAPLLVANFFIYCGSFMVFPGVIIRVDNDDAWFKIWIILVFQGVLTLGRALAQPVAHYVPKLGSDARMLIGVAVVRATVCVPIFVSALADHPSRKGAAYGVVVVFQLTAGLLSGLVAGAVPKAVAAMDPADRDAVGLSGTVFSLSILGSCICGSLSNLAICHFVL